MHSQEGYFGVCFLSCESTREINTKITLKRGHYDSLEWRHNECGGISNHQPHDCLLNCLFRQRKHQSSTSLAFVQGIHRWPVNSLHKGPVMRKMFLFNDVIMCYLSCLTFRLRICFSISCSWLMRSVSAWLCFRAMMYACWSVYCWLQDSIFFLKVKY